MLSHSASDLQKVIPSLFPWKTLLQTLQVTLLQQLLFGIVVKPSTLNKIYVRPIKNSTTEKLVQRIILQLLAVEKLKFSFSGKCCSMLFSWEHKN